MNQIISLGLLGGMLLFSGCKSSNIYYWGHYEKQMHDMYAAPDKATAEQQTEQMEADFEKARSQNLPIHPGFHAHLGYLYFQVGKNDLARREFESEKAAFPESALLMDRFISKL